MWGQFFIVLLGLGLGITSHSNKNVLLVRTEQEYPTYIVLQVCILFIPVF